MGAYHTCTYYILLRHFCVTRSLYARWSPFCRCDPPSWGGEGGRTGGYLRRARTTVRWNLESIGSHDGTNRPSSAMISPPPPSWREGGPRGNFFTIWYLTILSTGPSPSWCSTSSVNKPTSEGELVAKWMEGCSFLVHIIWILQILPASLPVYLVHSLVEPAVSSILVSLQWYS